MSAHLCVGPAPFAWRHRPACLFKLLFQGNIVEIAADSQLPIGIGADISLHQHLGATAGPDLKLGRLNLLEAWPGKAFRADGLEQTVVSEIRRDDLRKRLTERPGRSGAGRGRDVGIGGKGRNGNAKVLPLALVRDRTGQPFFLGGRRRGLLRQRRRGEEQGEGQERAGFHCDNFLSKRNEPTRFHAS